jgi:isoleucyl-tRNA synthetase
MSRFATVSAQIVEGYDDYRYPAIYQAASTFLTVDLSAFYVDVTKDRMYTFGATSAARRSGQTAMFAVADGMARLLAPILPFTMDEIWRHLPGPREESVHLALFPAGLSDWVDEALVDRWTQLSNVRDRVNGALEEKRQQKLITASLSARVSLAASGALGTLLADYRDELPTIFGVSQVDLDQGFTPESDAPEGVRVNVDRADGTKCERCWRFVPSVSESAEFKGLCDRCVDALAEPAAPVSR